MSRLGRGLSSLARRTGLVSADAARIRLESRARSDWRWPLDDALLRRLERLSLAPGARASAGLGGEHRSRQRAASTDFVDYRAYLPGDDFRQIDWNVYSRLDQLYLKQTEARERLTMYLLLDGSASMDFGNPNKLDYARQLAAAIGYVCLVRYDRLQVVCSAGHGRVSRPLRGKHRFAELLAALDRVDAAGDAFLEPRAVDFSRATAGGQAVVISDMLQPDGYERGLESLASAGLSPSVVQVLSPEEVRPKLSGDFELVDLESGERVEVGASSQVLDRYRSRLADWCADLERYCAGRGLPYLQAVTDEPLERVVLVGARQAGILN